MTILKRIPEQDEGSCKGCYFYDEEALDDCTKTRHIRKAEDRAMRWCFTDGFVYVEVKRP